MIDIEQLWAEHGDDICQVCNEEIEKNLSPSNPTCEGRWCDQAIELFLEREDDQNECKDL